MRIAIRNLVGHPGLALSTLGMLAMALAFVVASLSVLNGLLIRPYPYPRLGQLMLIRDSTPREGAHQGRAIAAADFLDIRRAVAAFSSVAGWRTYPSVITGADRDPERVEGLAVTANFFGMLGVSPLVGQGFAVNADVAGQDAVVLLSRRLWSSRFGGDPSIVGRAIGLNGRPVTVLGIIRDEDCYPPGIDAWTPLVFSRSDMTERAAQHVAAIGRFTDTATEHEQLLNADGYKRGPVLQPGDNADNVRYDASANRLYIGFGSGAIGAVDPSNSMLLAQARLPGHPESFQLEHSGSRIFVNVPTASQVAVIDRVPMRVVATWPVNAAGACFPMALDETNHRVFIGCRKPATVLVLDTNNGSKVASFEIVGDTDDLFYDPVRKRLYVSGGDGFIDVVEEQAPNTFTRIAHLATAAGARTALFASERNRFYLAVPHRNDQRAEVRVYDIH